MADRIGVDHSQMRMVPRFRYGRESRECYMCERKQPAIKLVTYLEDHDGVVGRAEVPICQACIKEFEGGGGFREGVVLHDLKEGWWDGSWRPNTDDVPRHDPRG
jgi:hypothetical protein